MDVRILERQTTKSDVKLLARALVDLRDRVIQKARIQFGNRLAALENGSDESPYRYYLQKWYERFAEIEKDLDASIADIAGDFPIVERMTNVKGVGKTLALKVVAMIDIERARADEYLQPNTTERAEKNIHSVTTKRADRTTTPPPLSEPSSWRPV